MLNVESISRNATARAFRMVEASPEALRECASRLEAARRESWIPGDTITVELSPTVVVAYKPDREIDAQLHLPIERSPEDNL